MPQFVRLLASLSLLPLASSPSHHRHPWKEMAGWREREGEKEWIKRSACRSREYKGKNGERREDGEWRTALLPWHPYPSVCRPDAETYRVCVCICICRCMCARVRVSIRSRARVAAVCRCWRRRQFDGGGRQRDCGMTWCRDKREERKRERERGEGKRRKWNRK